MFPVQVQTPELTISVPTMLVHKFSIHLFDYTETTLSTPFEQFILTYEVHSLARTAEYVS